MLRFLSGIIIIISLKHYIIIAFKKSLSNIIKDFYINIKAA